MGPPRYCVSYDRFWDRFLCLDLCHSVSPSLVSLSVRTDVNGTSDIVIYSGSQVEGQILAWLLDNCHTQNDQECLYCLKIHPEQLRHRFGGGNPELDLAASAIKPVTYSSHRDTVAHESGEISPLPISPELQRASVQFQYTPLEQYCPDVITWILEASTGPDVITICAEMVIEVAWLPRTNIRGIIQQLQYSFGFGSHEELLPLSRRRAEACHRALIHLGLLLFSNSLDRYNEYLPLVKRFASHYRRRERFSVATEPHAN